MAQVTSSATRSKRQKASKAVVRSSSGRSNRQKVSNATVTDSGGRGSNAGSAKVTIGQGSEPAKLTSNQGMTIRGTGRLGAAVAGIQAYNTGDSTLKAAQRRGDYKPKQGPADPDRGLSKAASFDKAFASARKSGKKTFNWNGKQYTTETK